jgi:hypothetical protein
VSDFTAVAKQLEESGLPLSGETGLVYTPLATVEVGT